MSVSVAWRQTLKSGSRVVALRKRLSSTRCFSISARARVAAGFGISKGPAVEILESEPLPDDDNVPILSLDSPGSSRGASSIADEPDDLRLSDDPADDEKQPTKQPTKPLTKWSTKFPTFRIRPAPVRPSR